MKPLSIEELKQLKEYDYFWLVNINDANKNIYISNISYTKETLSGLDFYNYSRRMKWDNYGKTWVAYKNKEQAECKGELVELPCKVGDKVYYLNTRPSISLKTNTIYEGKVVRFHILNSLDMAVFLDIKIHNEYGTTEISNTKDFGVLVFKTREQAEEKLKELRGEV